MKIQFFSDVHLEFGRFEVDTDEADVIVAAGDIGVGLQGIEWLETLDTNVLYVAGNHEYYGGDIIHTQAAIAARAEAGKVQFLENSIAVVDGVRFLGATLWTDFLDGDAGLLASAPNTMNDFHQIRCDGRPLQPTDLLERHRLSRAWFAETLAQPFSGPTVVVSHHAPSLRSWHEDPASEYRGFYCTELAPMIEQNAVDLWIHGHVHAVADYAVGPTRVLCNPRGYHGYQQISGFSGQRMVTL